MGRISTLGQVLAYTPGKLWAVFAETGWLQRRERRASRARSRYVFSSRSPPGITAEIAEDTEKGKSLSGFLCVFCGFPLVLDDAEVGSSSGDVDV